MEYKEVVVLKCLERHKSDQFRSWIRPLCWYRFVRLSILFSFDHCYPRAAFFKSLEFMLKRMLNRTDLHKQKCRSLYQNKPIDIVLQRLAWTRARGYNQHEQAALETEAGYVYQTGKQENSRGKPHMQLLETEASEALWKLAVRIMLVLKWLKQGWYREKMHHLGIVMLKKKFNYPTCWEQEWHQTTLEMTSILQK